MIPVLSTRAFGRLPMARDFALARRLGFLDFALWMEPLERLASTGFDEWRALRSEMGVRLASVHLPATDHTRALDHAVELGARLAVVHSPTADRAFERLVEEASERSIRLAFENDVGPGTSALELVHGLVRAGQRASHHGLCLDLSRMRPPLPGELLGRIACVEASSLHMGRPHRPPDPDDRPVRELLRAVPVEAVTYEVVPLGPETVPPGEAQLTTLLRSVIAFHLGAAGSVPAAPSSSPPT